MAGLLFVQLTDPAGVTEKVIPLTLLFTVPDPQTVCEAGPPPETLTVGVILVVMFTVAVLVHPFEFVPVTV